MIYNRIKNALGFGHALECKRMFLENTKKTFGKQKLNEKKKQVVLNIFPRSLLFQSIY